ncbi:hypothetical protein DFQ28_011348 [Apophysomyces sp. BC1034]|nr:hypothetical protein DFQ30_011132 [Apophysomyces sp. BC1015]KAG0169416.1 hypothetical protein DFQ29_009693 [Apophysomyces sp. BC1021]KAG0184352.1 hypothetical protein DFQ28_011348 [Apophysomyces sp. BC1034]
MRLASLSEELDAITRDYDYGIVPGSATVFVKDTIAGIGRLDLTLLEGVIVVIELSDGGYKVVSCSPLCNIELALTTAQEVHPHMNAQFESMENLLMTISPMFREKFQQTLFERLQSVQNHDKTSLENGDAESPLSSINTTTTFDHHSSTHTSTDIYDELHDWMH